MPGVDTQMQQLAQLQLQLTQLQQQQQMQPPLSSGPLQMLDQLQQMQAHLSKLATPAAGGLGGIIPGSAGGLGGMIPGSAGGLGGMMPGNAGGLGGMMLCSAGGLGGMPSMLNMAASPPGMSTAHINSFLPTAAQHQFPLPHSDPNPFSSMTAMPPGLPPLHPSFGPPSMSSSLLIPPTTGALPVPSTQIMPPQQHHPCTFLAPSTAVPAAGVLGVHGMGGVSASAAAAHHGSLPAGALLRGQAALRARLDEEAKKLKRKECNR
jgi:hypothetical protein